MIHTKNGFIIDPDVESFILKSRKDFRLCTTCSGPVIVPTELKPVKPSDIRIKIGDNTLYVSRIQARFTRRIEKFMLIANQHPLLCNLY
ncbi:MAG: hypothetical protein JXA38_07350 [Methanosarcinaceae archaeon]|nr:hypothetical protein [Methanosarcinaceae archaeon]